MIELLIKKIKKKIINSNYNNNNIYIYYKNE